MTTNKESKRILSVTVKRIADYDADISYLGEFSDTPKDFAIVAVGEHAGEFVADLSCTCGHADHSENVDSLCGEPVEGSTCDCDYFERDLPERGREFRYFNGPTDNYDGESDENIRLYCLQDYKRIRGLDSGDWGFIGIKASAEVQLANAHAIQTITSGGLWGIESDSGDSYFKEVEGEELSQLREELHAIGFTKRAIAAAMRDVKRSE